MNSRDREDDCTEKRMVGVGQQISGSMEESVIHRPNLEVGQRRRGDSLPLI